MSKEIGITVKKAEDFSEWYTQLVLKAEVADYASVKGSMVLKPYGYSIWERIREYLDDRFKETGHSNAYFPALIPESFLKKEAEHFAGFTPEVFWITHSGNDQLSERLALRPTSETIINDSFSRWVRSWRDLPLLLNCWNSVFRAEIKATRPLMRTTEFLWQEGHTVHATREDADKEVFTILGIYRDLAEKVLAIPALTGTKTSREKFVGALYTTTLESLMPDGKALQMGTSHNLGQNFAKAFEIKYIGKDEQNHYAWTTSWGMSWRLIGALIMVHGDDRGLVLPPEVAPIQCVIVTIHYKDADRVRISRKASAVHDTLTKVGIRARVDDREQYTPGWKFNEWELKGVPLRIEIGPRDLKARQITLVRRDTLERLAVKDRIAIRRIKGLLKEIQQSLLQRAKTGLKSAIKSVTEYEQFKSTIEGGGILRACWCSRLECEDKVHEETGATIRTVPLEPEKVFSPCICCGKPAEKVAYFARAH